MTALSTGIASLAELFESNGERVHATKSDAVPLVDPTSVLYVNRGHLDIVAMVVAREEGAPTLQRAHLMRIKAGDLFFGFHGPPGGRQVVMLGYGSGDADVFRLPLDQLKEAAESPSLTHEVVSSIDRWVSALCELCTGDLAPTGALNVRPDSRAELHAGQSAQPQSGVIWIEPYEGCEDADCHPCRSS